MDFQLSQIGREHLNQVYKITVLLTDVRIRFDRNQKRYADLQVQDQSMKTVIRLWDYDQHEETLKSLELPALLDSTVQVGEYRGQIQLTAQSIEKTENTDITMEQFIQSSSWDSEKMKQWLKEFKDMISASPIRALVEKMVFTEPYHERFCTYPAALKVHHQYRGGILQHTLEVLKYAKMVANTKGLSQRQQDRLLAMTFLHDWAKLMEYHPVPMESMTTEGKMLGHIFIGAHHARNVIDQIDGFDETDALVILNGILGHHGSHEWGSPVLPKTVEAQILHQADKLSGDVESILSFVAMNPEEEDAFTEKLWNMGTEYYRGGRS